MAVTGWKLPGTAENINYSGNVWSNVDNIKADDSVYATCPLTVLFAESDFLRGTNFGFTSSDIPANSVIDGIEIEIQRKCIIPAIATEYVSLLKGGVEYGDFKIPGTSWTTSEAPEVHGSSSDLWGGTWTQPDIVDSGFGFDLIAYLIGAADTASVDCFRIRVYFTPPVIGTIAAEIAALTADLNGDVSIDGALAANLSPATGSLTGAVNISGNLAATLLALISSLGGGVKVTGNQSANLAALTAALSGGVLITGEQTAILASLVATLSGNVAVGGSLNAQLANLLAALESDVKVDGTLSALMTPLVAALSGTIILAEACGYDHTYHYK